jgi:outer membrane protein assembly factor BamD (BamD/ComL family)
MNRRLVIVLLSLCFTLSGVRVILAQYGQNTQFGQDENQPLRSKFSDQETKSEKKTPGWLFHTPARDSAKSQLEYANSLLRKGKTKSAMKAYGALVYEWGSAPEAAKAQLEYAKLLEETGHYRDAFDEFQYLINFYAGQFPYNEALEHQFKIANYTMTTPQARWFFGGVMAPERALSMFEKIVENGPNWKRAAEAEFYVGVINEDMKEYESASLAYETLERRYRGSDLAKEAAFRHACCQYFVAKRSPRDEKGYRDALSALSMFVRDYPGNKNMETARNYLDELKEQLAAMYYDRANFYDRIARRPEAAIISYNDLIKNFPSSEKAQRANERIEQLKAQLEKKNEI